MEGDRGAKTMQSRVAEAFLRRVLVRPPSPGWRDPVRTTPGQRRGFLRAP